MSQTFDCIVVGVGGYGSGALYHLANGGASVLGLERFGVAHDRGSSHGETRIIRKAYFEHPDYVPLCVEAYNAWNALENETGETLYRETGLMLAGPPEGEAVAGARLAAERFGVTIDNVDPSDAARFRGFRIPAEFDVVFEPQAGFLSVEACVRTHIEAAVRHGAKLNTGEAVLDWTVEADVVRVRTTRAAYEAARMIIAAGPWSAAIVRDLGVELRVARKPMTWHRVRSDVYNVAAGAPAFYFDTPEGAFYGSPSLDGKSLKVAEHTGGEDVIDPSNVDRQLRTTDVVPVARFLREFLADVEPEPMRHSVCMYTLSPDHHFIVDRLPGCGNVVVGAGFSGHGFKFTSVLGRALAELALDGRTDLPIQFLSLERFRPHSPPACTVEDP